MCYVPNGTQDQRVKGFFTNVNEKVQKKLTEPKDITESEQFSRIRKAFKGASNAEIARQMNVSKTSVGNWQKGEGPGRRTLSQIAELTKTSLHWLIFGEESDWLTDPGGGGEAPIYFGEKEREIIQELAVKNKLTFMEEVRELVLEALLARGLITNQVSDNVTLEYFGDQVPRLVPMRLYGEIAAGAPIEVFEGDETVLIAEDFATAGNDIFVLRVRGDSMMDEGILDRDLIICRRTHLADNGDKVVALIDGTKSTVKKFYKERGRIRLQPANPRYDPIYVEPDRLIIQGIVIGIQRRT